MQLFNKSQRIFAISGGRIAPQETFEVDDKEGKRLLQLYPNEIIELKTTTVTVEKDKAKVKEKTKTAK